MIAQRVCLSIDRRRLLAIAVCAALPLATRTLAADPPPDGKVLILAAASTTEVVDEIRDQFVKLHPAVTVRSSFGASSNLAQQITAGAEVDLFLSASTDWADYLDKRKLVDRRRDLLGNQLVVVVAAGSPLKINRLEDLTHSGIEHLALADTRSVPAGIYARQTLEKAGLWKQLEKRATGAADVRQALNFVETGAAAAGIVYATDVEAAKGVRVAMKIDPQLSPPIRYPLVLVARGKPSPAAMACYEFFSSSTASAVFRKHGFIVLADQPAKP